MRNLGKIPVPRSKQRPARDHGTPERSAVLTKMKELLELGRRSGYRREDLLEMLQTLPG